MNHIWPNSTQPNPTHGSTQQMSMSAVTKSMSAPLGLKIKWASGSQSNRKVNRPQSHVNWHPDVIKFTEYHAAAG